jgi:hypothetical protein
VIKLYYQLSPAIVKAMQEDEGVKAYLKAMIDMLIPQVIRGKK